MSDKPTVSVPNSAYPWITAILEHRSGPHAYSVMYRQVACWNYTHGTGETCPDNMPYTKQGVHWISGVHGPDSDEYKAMVVAYCLQRGI